MIISILAVFLGLFIGLPCGIWIKGVVTKILSDGYFNFSPEERKKLIQERKANVLSNVLLIKAIASGGVFFVGFKLYHMLVQQ
jgi:hypothetical protein